MWLRGRDGDVTAELGGTSERRGRGGGRGNGERQRRQRSGFAAESEGEERRGLGRVSESGGSRGVRGTLRCLQRRAGKQEVAGALGRVRHASVLLARRKTTGGGVEMGWAAQELGRLATG